MSRARFTKNIPFSDGAIVGEYALGLTSGIIPATPLAAKEVFQFRWNPTNRNLLAVIRRIRVSAAVSTTYFAAGVPLELGLTKATGWSAQGTLGSGVTIDAGAKRKASMPSSALVAGDCRIAGTDTNGLGAGTKTLAGNPIAHIISGAPITSSLSGQVFPPNTVLYEPDLEAGDFPIVLTPGAGAANAEGLAIVCTAPATGTWRLSVGIEWDETELFPFNAFGA